MKRTLVRRYDNAKKTVTISLKYVVEKVRCNTANQRIPHESHKKTFKQSDTAAIDEYCKELMAILEKEEPKHYRERQYQL